MVKIINPLGDVKVGRQGEAVYQRKYGEQVRRTVQPKRGIVSQAQINHRNLYRAALDWRKSLSLPNRRYLDGYCIANWVVDDHQIPLPWSKFAIKLYLQRVGFVLLTKPAAAEEGQEALFENYQYVSHQPWTFADEVWVMQSFTPLVSHKITKIGAYLARNYYPGMSTISIKAVDGEGKPTGADLTFADFNANDLPETPPVAFVYFDLPEYQLVADTQYAMVIRAPLGAGAQNIMLSTHGATPTYTRGLFARSMNAGSTWTLFEGTDAYFEEYGIGQPTPGAPGLIHVRHPALLTVVHKRNGVTINGYDTLSSLDEEYLTKQVGLDVQSGDIIEATTLPGINYKYLVG